MTDRENRMNKGTAQKRSILMICASFFGYDKRICRALQDEGYEVDLLDEKPNSGFVAKACIRYNVGLYRPVIKKYIKSISAKNGTKQYDYVFVVKGEAINEDALMLLRDAYPKAKFILYLWDSVSNIPDCETRMEKYDRVLTFDPQDAKEYGIAYRPLFFGKEYESAPSDNRPFEYDFSFIGTAHTCRPRIVNELGKNRLERGRKYFSFLYLPHPLVFAYNKALNRDYAAVKKSDISFVPMSAAEIKAVYSKSKCILDVEHQKQRGLTMRTIELVGMQKKIITSNPMVKEYDFYNPANICVIDRQNPVVEESFWDLEYEPVPQQILDKYSIKAFVREIFDLKETEYGK